jgi:peptidoglycan/LPS O-acetylase OafA/YrhL
MNDSHQDEVQPIWKAGKHCVELDGVRGLAILLVTLYRFSKELDPTYWPSWLTIACFRVGERGVDLFFVLSGFLITSILLQSKNSPHYFQHFFIRRSLRIFPLYFLALFIFVWIVPTLLPNVEMFQKPVDKQFYLWTYLSNFKMAFENAWCFGPLDHFWSLAVEEHFYFIWPVVIYFASTRRALMISIATIVLIGAGRIACSSIDSLSVAVEVLSVFRFDALCLGTSIALLLSQAPSAKKHMGWLWLAIVPIAVLCVASAMLDKRVLTLPHTLCPIVWAALLWQLLGSKPTARIASFFRNPSLRWLGKYSYAMYVFQLPLIVLVAPLINVQALTELVREPTLAGFLYINTMFGITCILAWISFHAFEKHFLKLKPTSVQTAKRPIESISIGESVSGWNAQAR